MRVAMEDVYSDAIPKASQAMLFCLSDLTRTPNRLKIPYVLRKPSIVFDSINSNMTMLHYRI